MTEETKPDRYGGLRAVARWMRDQFALLFVTGWLYLLGWGIVLGAFAILLYMDGHFSRSLAVDGTIAPVAFMAMGWVFRFFAAVFLLASERQRASALANGADEKEVKRQGKVWRRLGFAVSVLVCAHAIGIGLEALDAKRDTAIVEKQTATNLVVQTDGVEARLEQRKDGIRADLALAVAPLQARIDKLDTDGELNEDRTDQLQARIESLEDAAQAKIDAIDTQILGLIAPESAEAAAEAAKAKAEVDTKDGWTPLFVGLAQLASWKQEPADWTIYLCAVAFIAFWVLCAEAIVIFVPKELFKMHLADSQAAEKRDRSRAHGEASQAGKRAADLERKFSDLQNKLDEMEKADTTRSRRVGKMIEGAGYYKAVADHLLEAKTARPRLTMKGMIGVDKYGTKNVRTVAELEGILRSCVEHGFLAREGYDFLTGTPAVNGHDTTPAPQQESADDDQQPQSAA
ncbi:MAG: hypothetical protein AAGK02_09700 [Pseudomonadota bacterium]